MYQLYQSWFKIRFLSVFLIGIITPLSYAQTADLNALCNQLSEIKVVALGAEIEICFEVNGLNENDHFDVYIAIESPTNNDLIFLKSLSAVFSILLKRLSTIKPVPCFF